MRIDRLFEMVYLLLERPVITAKELAERFEVSERTVYRDVETLSMAGDDKLTPGLQQLLEKNTLTVLSMNEVIYSEPNNND